MKRIATNKEIFAGVGTIIIIGIVVTGGMIIRENRKNKHELQKSEQEDWKYNQEKENIITYYENKSYNYRIENLTSFNVETGSVKNPDSLIKIISKADNTPLFSIDAEISKFSNVNDWLDDYQKKLSQITSYEGVEINPPVILSKEKIYIDGIEAIKLTIENMPYSDYLIAIIKNKFIYTISYNGLLLTSEKDALKEQSNNQSDLALTFKIKHRAELDKIIDSFRFVN
ncbi:MAG: Uncharacterized protein Athens071425_504 [Parcubacteria group bacterium Athens0714_25]|nr:MAG: Uncharacterized protein Athens071425_504 [Parcubacteria group bacterium Athens0714_25]